jgi:peptide/nickel transport system substrate-binding protein
MRLWLRCFWSSQRGGSPRPKSRRRWSQRLLLVSAAVLAALFALGSGPVSASARGTRHPASTARGKTGGTLRVLEGATFLGNDPSGLDPPTSSTALANASMLDAIYGELFEVGAHGKLVPDLATAYHLSDGGKTLTIDLRHGVTFSDGTPFDAAAVVFNFDRDLGTTTTGSNPPWSHPVISAPNPYTVVVSFSNPDGAALDQLLDTNLSWIVSPTALKKLGEERFRVYPVGAGPFEVVSDTLDTKLVLKKNPHYWQPGHPYLDRLIFETVASDESALETLESRSAQAYEYMTTPQLLSAFKSAGLTVTADPGVSTLDAQIETIPPFTNLKAREALYYATDAAAIDQHIFHGTCPLSESFTGPGGLFYEPKVPGYRTYNLAKAKALVKSLGGLSFTMYYVKGGLNQDVAEALQTMYQDAGMKVALVADGDLAAFVAEYDTHKWTVIPASIGSFDPAGGIGVPFRLASTGPFTGIHDPIVDQYIDEGEAAVNPKVRAKYYADLAHYLSQEAYTPFICTPTSWDIAAKGVSGPGLTTATAGFGEGPLVRWEDVSMGRG